MFSSNLLSQIQFSETAQQVGINHTFIGIPGGGVSFVDFDNDGWDDITLATEDGKPISFFKNINGTFQQVPDFVGYTEDSKQILWVDFDNDGDKDLYVATHTGTNRLYENEGGFFTYSDITEAAGLPLETHTSYGTCFGDFNRDGWLDIYYSERKFPPSSGTNENRLFRNNADGTFTEVTNESMSGDEGKTPFCSAFFDYNNDMWPDIYTANDKLGENTLLENNGDGTFKDVGDTTQSNIVIDAMNVGIGDYDNDGWQDIYITNLPYGNALLKNNGATAMGNQITYEEVADDAGVGFYSTSWGANFLDADNDGWLDLYVSGPNSNTDTTYSSAFYHNNTNGTFSIPLNIGFEKDTLASFNNAIGDFNNDGFPDIMVINALTDKSQLWKNKSASNGNQWLKIDLEGVLSNKDAIGSKIEIFTGNEYQMRFTHCGIGFLGQNSTNEMFGLGNQISIDSINITWPTGHVDQLLEIASNQTLFILEGSTTNGEITIDDDVTLTIPIIDAVDKFSTKINLQLYPNPVQDEIHIEVEGATLSNYFIFTFDGKLVSVGKLNERTSIATGSFANGIYHFLGTNLEGDKVVKKFVVTR